MGFFSWCRCGTGTAGLVGHSAGGWWRKARPHVQWLGFTRSAKDFPQVILSAGFSSEGTYLQLSAPTSSWISAIRVPTNTLYCWDLDWIQCRTVMESVRMALICIWIAAKPRLAISMGWLDYPHSVLDKTTTSKYHKQNHPWLVTLGHYELCKK